MLDTAAANADTAGGLRADPAPGWHYTNQTGFDYQAQALHRCMAAGLRECPQYTRAESLHVLRLLDRIGQAEAQPAAAL